MAAAALAGEIPEGYTQVKVYDGTYGFGDAEISVATNNDFRTFYITFECFNVERRVTGTAGPAGTIIAERYVPLDLPAQ